MVLRSKVRFNVNDSIFLLCAIFLVLFPKGGFKIAELPITWGYMLLGLCSVCALVRLLTAKRAKVCRYSLLAYVSTVPFCLLSLISLFTLGYERLDKLLSFVLNFYLFPFLFFIVFYVYFKTVSEQKVLKIIKNMVFLIALYGIVLWLYHVLTGSLFGIPYITANVSDVTSGSWLVGKFNDRGGVSKLFSTYNNGNIYGVCVLMLLPLFFNAEKNKWKIGTVLLSLVLTLSRTVWLGLLFFFVLQYRKRLVKLIMVFATLVLLILLIVCSFEPTNYDTPLSFLFDESLGGRLRFFQEATLSVLPDEPFVEIRETVYLSILDTFGVVGFLLFLVSFLSPLLLFVLKRPRGTAFQTHCFFGLVVYSFVCLSDGAMELIPVMVFYYFLAAMALLPVEKKRI